jgi:GAF domain-containing protein
MLEQVRNIFLPPVFPEDEDKTRKARYANAIILAFLGIVFLFETFIRVSENYRDLSFIDLIMLGLAVLFITGLVLLRKGHVQLTSILLVVLVWMASNGLASTGFGAKDASYLTNFAIILMSGLLLGWPAALSFTVLSALSGFALAYAEQNELIVVPAYPILSFARDVTVVFILNGVLILLLITGLENALKRSRRHLQELESANTSLNATQTELEARTLDLLSANSQLENRTRKLHAVTEVTRTATVLRNFEELLTSIPAIISSQLGYQHVAIFLLDEQKQFAILRSANTEAGLMMIDRGHRISVGQLGMVSSVAQTGQPRIALDLDADKSLSPDSDLLGTRSQLVLPLKSGAEIIGVLDIQSERANDFTEDDTATLSILADQVGIALQNALLFEESQRALREANVESLGASRRAWRGYTEAIQTKGYRYDGIKSEPLREKNRPHRENESLLVPVQLRGQTIGRLRLNASDGSHIWTEDELLMVKATAERVALALEGTRLLEEAQKRATRESFLSEVAAKLSTSFQLDSILRDTVQELGQTLKNSTVTFQLVNPSTSQSSPESQRSNGAGAE